jgi:hypothetical protein
VTTLGWALSALACVAILLGLACMFTPGWWRRQRPAEPAEPARLISGPSYSMRDRVIPDGTVALATDLGVVKIGDGERTWGELPIVAPLTPHRRSS